MLHYFFVGLRGHPTPAPGMRNHLDFEAVRFAPDRGVHGLDMPPEEIGAAARREGVDTAV